MERFRKNHTLMLAVAIYVSMENSKILWLRSRGEHPSLNILGGFNIEHRTLFIVTLYNFKFITMSLVVKTQIGQI